MKKQKTITFIFLAFLSLGIMKLYGQEENYLATKRWILSDSKVKKGGGGIFDEQSLAAFHDTHGRVALPKVNLNNTMICWTQVVDIVNIYPPSIFNCQSGVASSDLPQGCEKWICYVLLPKKVFSQTGLISSIGEIRDSKKTSYSGVFLKTWTTMNGVDALDTIQPETLYVIEDEEDFQHLKNLISKNTFQKNLNIDFERHVLLCMANADIAYVHKKGTAQISLSSSHELGIIKLPEERKDILCIALINRSIMDKYEINSEYNKISVVKFQKP
jgi:hypothetical protein